MRPEKKILSSHNNQNITLQKPEEPGQRSCRTQMLAHATIPSKTLNHHRWRNQNILGQNQIQTVPIYQSRPTKDPNRKTPTQGKYLHQRKEKILSILEQSQKERTTST